MLVLKQSEGKNGDAVYYAIGNSFSVRWNKGNKPTVCLGAINFSVNGTDRSVDILEEFNYTVLGSGGLELIIRG